MLLETLDIKEDDVIIFSKNIFNLDNNFKKIKKDEPDKTPISISYSDVCNYINKFVPKNIIIYRLLLNIKDFQIQKSFYGHFMNIDGRTELVYFDPVFAIKELEEYAEKVSYLNLRFRIQQVGLTTLNRKGVLPNYAEIYNIDLEAEEAKYQNDSDYVEAILSKSSKDSTIKNLKTNLKVDDKELKKISIEQK